MRCPRVHRWRGPIGFAIACLLCGASQALELRTMTWGGHHYTVARIAFGKDHVALFNKDPQGQPFRRFSRLAMHLGSRGSRLVLAMNAGMFMTDLRPLGLYIADGQLQRRLNVRRGQGNFYLLPNGIFLMTARGFQIIDSDDYASLAEPALLATQSGPLLLKHGVRNPGISPAGVSRYVRNGVGLSSADSAWWVISDEPVTFFEFTEFFRAGLRCPDALYLDGHVSSLYAPQLARRDDDFDLGPMLAVIEALPPAAKRKSP